MLKRLSLLAGLLFCAPAFAAGTVPGFSLTPQFDSLGRLAPGCKLYIIQAGTTSTPQNAYQDSALTILHPNPLTCDSTGRLPQWFVADGQIKLRLTDRNSTAIFTQDNLLVIGPSGGGGGGGGTVDPTTVASTGDLKVSYGTTVLSGWVRANGRTIGSATSGATERANADCQALFSYLWGTDANLAVSGGRGASAAADWAANKTIALPDWRGRAIAGLDDMGNTAAGRLTATYFGAGPTTLGSAGSTSESTTLTLAQLPTGIATSSASTSVTLAATRFIPQTFNAMAVNPGTPTSGGVASVYAPSGAADWIVNSSTLTGTLSAGITATSTNTSGSPHRTVQPTMLATIYLKL